MQTRCKFGYENKRQRMNRIRAVLINSCLRFRWRIFIQGGKTYRRLNLSTRRFIDGVVYRDSRKNARYIGVIVAKIRRHVSTNVFSKTIVTSRKVSWNDLRTSFTRNYNEQKYKNGRIGFKARPDIQKWKNLIYKRGQRKKKLIRL